MKKILTLVAFGVLVSIGMSSTPSVKARPQQVPAPQELEARVAALEGELAVEKKRQDETRVLLDQTLAYLEKQSRAAQALLAVLDESEREGFAVGENYRSRQILLMGMRAYWGEEQGVPKAPATPAPVPPRAKLPARQ